MQLSLTLKVYYNYISVSRRLLEEEKFRCFSDSGKTYLVTPKMGQTSQKGAELTIIIYYLTALKEERGWAYHHYISFNCLENTWGGFEYNSTYEIKSQFIVKAIGSARQLLE